MPSVLALLAASLAIGAGPAEAATTSITVNGTQSRRPFDGIGAISGYGPNLQLPKLETGGDASSTSGSKPSTEHAGGQVNCNAGYEFWLAEQAKDRNPGIALYGLAWRRRAGSNTAMTSTGTSSCARQRRLQRRGVDRRRALLPQRR
ncbi:hypothetical protein [Amycolatopsis sp. cmx-4-83]|uniref:hypothetical protein n=1 Tax=Amycolatopsis sp. cmx-4-83 TaxID=2790940 RepID=UPI0039797DA2